VHNRNSLTARPRICGGWLASAGTACARLAGASHTPAAYGFVARRLAPIAPYFAALRRVSANVERA
jgi:hypothetical protein